MVKWFMRHKYKIMFWAGLGLTCCLFFELIKLACWIRVLINIASMIGSGVLCSTIVSWFVEKSNKKQNIETAKEQRKFILSTLCRQLKSILSWEIRALSQYSHIRFNGKRKVVLVESAIDDGVKTLKELVMELNQSDDSIEQNSWKIDIEYMKRRELKSKYLYQELMPYYRAIHKTLISIIENSHVYLLSKILNQKDIETLKNFEHIIESIIWSAETNDNSIILAYKEDLAENLLLYFECIGVDLKEKIEYGKEMIEIENEGDVKE